MSDRHTVAAAQRKRAKGRARFARWAERQRQHKLNPTRFDGLVAYDGAVLAMLVLRGYISDDDSADRNKVNAALTRLISDEAYHPAATHCPRCNHDLTRLR